MAYTRNPVVFVPSSCFTLRENSMQAEDSALLLNARFFLRIFSDMLSKKEKGMIVIVATLIYIMFFNK